MLRVGILGTGTMGTLHVHHLLRISDVHLVGVTAEPASEADALAASLGVQRYNSAEALLSDPTILRVTPEDALKALEAGLAAMESAATGRVITLTNGGGR